MKFISFLNEGRSREISDEKFRDMLPDFSDALKGSPIYRGMDYMGTMFYSDPSKFPPRKSAYAQGNYYTLLLDYILPEWRKYPKRSKSVVCALDPFHASNYGQVYRILPKNGTKIAVCPKEDIWTSFNLLWGNFGTLNHLNVFLSQMGISDKNPKVLEQGIKNLIITEMEFLYEFHSDIKKYDTFYDFLRVHMSPDKNGFKIIRSGQKITGNEERELWTEGPLLGITEERGEKILNEI